MQDQHLHKPSFSFWTCPKLTSASYVHPSLVSLFWSDCSGTCTNGYVTDFGDSRRCLYLNFIKYGTITYQASVCLQIKRRRQWIKFPGSTESWAFVCSHHCSPVARTWVKTLCPCGSCALIYSWGEIDFIQRKRHEEEERRFTAGAPIQLFFVLYKQDAVSGGEAF